MTIAGVRLSSGALRGRRLKVEAGVRPTAARVREALLDLWRPRIAGARVLDLFAGSGAVGLSALGCGAAHCTFVEAERRVVRELAAAVDRCAVGERAHVLRARVGEPGWSSSLDGPFDLVFADPPYASDAYDEWLVELAEHLGEGAEVAIEMASEQAHTLAAVDGFELVGARRYGDSTLVRLRRVGHGEGEVGS